MTSTKKGSWRRVLSVAAATTVLLAASVVSAQAYDATPGTVYQLGSDPCLKGRGNCVIYGKSTQLPSGRLLVAFEKSTIPESGTADGQTVPVMKSDDYGASWQPLAEVAAPAYMTDDPALDKYTSNWTSTYLYVLPETVGDLEAGTILLATVVSGEDEYYVERKAADPNWVPTNDGDRRDMAIALYSSADEGATWSFVNIAAEGGWQGGSAGNIGTAIASANTFQQIDPVWEPHLEVHDGKLVVYYSDENDYIGYDPVTGVAILDPDNDTAVDSRNQVLVHKTWDGTGSDWSAPVIDVAGLETSMGGGKTVIGGGRPGMTTIAKTTDDKWLLTFEYFGGGSNTRYKLSDDPLNFFADGDADGVDVATLPLAAGSRALARGGSPVVMTLPDGRIAYNSNGSGNVWVNQSGRSDGAWTEFQTTVGNGYSRTMQYVEGTGRISFFQSVWGGPTAGSIIRHASVDLGNSDGAYYRLVNRKTGQVLGTGGKINDANIGNADVPDVRLEPAVAGATTQYWHLATKPNGKMTLLNKSGGRAAGIWTGNATVGQRIGQWVDQGSAGLWNIVPTDNGYVKLQAAANTNVYLTGATAGAAVTLQTASTDGGQEWQLVQEAPAAAALTTRRESTDLIDADPAVGATIPLDASVFAPSGAARNANKTGTVYTVVGSTVTRLGNVAFDAEQRGTVTLPSSLTAGTAFRLAVAFDETPLIWDSATVRAGVSVDVVSSTRCVAGKVVVTVKATNTGDTSIDIGVSGAYGSKSMTAVAPGNSSSAAFSTRQASVPSGSLAVTAAVTGEPVTYTTSAEIPARDCG